MVKQALFILFAMSLVSCGKTSLVGKWHKSKGNYTIDFTEQRDFKYEGTLSEPPHYYQFKTSGKYKFDSNTVTLAITDYAIDESRLNGASKTNLAQIKASFDELKTHSLVATYTIDGDILMLSGQGITGTYMRGN